MWHRSHSHPCSEPVALQPHAVRCPPDAKELVAITQQMVPVPKYYAGRHECRRSAEQLTKIRHRTDLIAYPKASPAKLNFRQRVAKWRDAGPSGG